MLGDKFMLTGETAAELYNKVAKDAPIYDYHCHLSAREIYEDEVFSDISALWLEHDHYKWRAMRYAGVSEECITGIASALTKFKAWARTCERLIGSPLYHWTNLELKNYFGMDEILRESNAERIYTRCNAKIKEEALSPVKLIQKSKVKLICTTDDPTDRLEYHKKLLERKELGFQILPTFRPDKALNIQKDTFTDYVEQLSESSNRTIKSYSDLIEALTIRIEEFKNYGCRLSDHSMENMLYIPASREEIEEIFAKRLTGKAISQEEAEKYKIHTLILLASEYRKAGWVMQLHIGAMRNTNERLFRQLGLDAGFDIMNDFTLAQELTRILNEMDRTKGLPKTILYNLNSKDNLALASIPHCFPEDGVPGKIQFGPAWWFNDNKDGIVEHLTMIANQGMLAYFTGMLTDSRSFLSYVRHDYFRRILCGFVGELVDRGEVDRDMERLKEIIEGICFKNIIHYLGMEEE